MASVSINSVSYKGNSTVDVSGTVYDLPSSGVTVYISFRNENSSYKDFSSLYTYVSNPVSLSGIKRNFTIQGIQNGYLSSDTTWYVSGKCGSYISSEKSIYMPFEGPIPSDFIIPERPTQQSQGVVYNTAYKGEAGSCVANALASVKNIQELRNGKDVLDYSVMWLFGGAGDGYTEGLRYETALNFLKSRGMPPYQVVSNNLGVVGYPDIAFQKDAKTVYNQNNNTTINNFALPQKIKSWTAVGNGSYDYGFYNQIIDAIKTKTVIMTMGIDKSLDDAYSNGVVGGIVGQVRDGHAVIVIGIKTINGKKHWVVQNSWTYRGSGGAMGDSGLYYIPFSWFTFNWCGIRGFYIIEDDPSAPPLPQIPDIVDPPMISVRDYNRLKVYTSLNASATGYQFRYNKVGTTSYQYNSNYTILRDKVYCELEGMISGTTYELSARMNKNGAWSKWSNISIGTTSPWRGKIFKHVCYNNTSVSLCTRLDDGYDGGGYTGVMYRVYLYDGSYQFIKDVYGRIDVDCVISGLISGKRYDIEPWVYYSVNGSDVSRSGFTVSITFDYAPKPPPFSWTYPKAKGNTFNLKAFEWNDFMDWVANMSKYYLLVTHIIPHVKPNDKCTSGWNGNMEKVINNVNRIMNLKYGDYDHQFKIPNRGSSVEADWLNNMVKEINEML